MTRSSQPQLQPPRTSHLGWLYLLAAVPALLGAIEAGGLRGSPRNLVSEAIMTVFVVLFVNVIIRRSKALAEEMRAHLESNAQLHHSNRLATVGQLAAGIAHELGSPLQVVAGRAKMISNGDTAEEARESGRIIYEQANRMATIISGLLGFARRRRPTRATTDLESIARDVHLMLAPIARKQMVSLELAVGRPRAIDVDAHQVQQALTNLVMNAIQAVGEGGHVAIQVEHRRVEPPPDLSGVRRIPETRTRSHGRVTEVSCLHVTDDGPGIDETEHSRVFEPFFTTKDVGEGTGLGLAIAHGLVRDNGGWITVQSEVGSGARFSIFFPCGGTVG